MTVKRLSWNAALTLLTCYLGLTHIGTANPGAVAKDGCGQATGAQYTACHDGSKLRLFLTADPESYLETRLESVEEIDQFGGVVRGDGQEKIGESKVTWSDVTQDVFGVSMITGSLIGRVKGDRLAAPPAVSHTTSFGRFVRIETTHLPCSPGQCLFGFSGICTDRTRRCSNPSPLTPDICRVNSFFWNTVVNEVQQDVLSEGFIVSDWTFASASNRLRIRLSVKARVAGKWVDDWNLWPAEFQHVVDGGFMTLPLEATVNNADGTAVSSPASVMKLQDKKGGTLEFTFDAWPATSMLFYNVGNPQ